MSKYTALIQTLRVPFLVLTPICVFLGVSLVVYSGGSVDSRLLLLVLTAAICAHISVNTLNEYMDFNSGLDLLTNKTAFSGGSGALPKYPEMKKVVLAIGIVSLLVTVAIGLYFISRFGLSILPLGVLGVFLIVSYTGWINKYPLLCLIAPGLGFGFLFVIGSQYVLTGSYLSLSWQLAIIPFALVNNLLLLNQYPDCEADKTAGRNHFPIAFGVTKSNVIYGLFVGLAIVVLLTLVLLNYLPILSLVALLPLPLAFYALSGAIKHGKNIGKHPRYLASNVLVALTTPLLLAVSIVFW
ncbi:MAG TPA: prenyltransferase [Oceanospirillales bacterium]|nr:prenyltransferase [Oceanospirillales bacterium]